MRATSAVVSITLAFALGACSEHDSTVASPSADLAHASAPAPAARPAAAAVPPKAWPRQHTPELDALRRALDLGTPRESAPLLAHAAEAGDEALLLRARAAAQGGKGIEALRLVEEARAKNPADPSVYATAAEIWAGSDGFDSAAREITQGEKLCGPSAELLRARGIVALSRPGGSARGLEDLESALRADPQLPFALRALGQAHLLLGKEAAKAQKLAAALEHAQLSVHFDPEETDAQRFLSECQAAQGDYDAALATLRALVRKGEPLSAEVALMEKRAGVAALLRDDRVRALAHFLEARAEGLTDAELATGARLLAEESQKHLDAGVEAYAKHELENAEREFRAALVYDDDSIAAQNHLAVTLFQRAAYVEAARLWSRVLETATGEGIELPEPVHLNLAEAQLRGGDPAAARATLERYLASAPAGRWAERTRAALEALDARR